MIPLLLLSLLILSSQANGQEDYEDFCENLANTTSCYGVCSNCFVLSPAECSECVEADFSDIDASVCPNLSTPAENSTSYEFDCSMAFSSATTPQPSTTTQSRIILYAAIGGGVGGGVLVLCCLCITVCCCCYCCRKRRKSKSFELEHAVESHGNNESLTQTAGDATTNEFNMQANFALSEDTEVPLLLPPPPAKAPPQGPPRIVTSSFIETTAIKKSASLDALESHTIEATNPSLPKHGKPATLPKPAALRATLTTTAAPGNTHTTQGQKQRCPSPSPSPNHTVPSPSPAPAPSSDNQDDSDSQQEDDYESPELFKIDAEKQKVENYYNKDAVLLPQSAEPEPPQGIYANVDPDTEGGDGNDEQTGSYETVRDYMANIDQDETNEGGVYYNLPDTGNRNIEELEDEDNMYVYMRSGLNIDQDTPLTETPPKTERKRHQSEPVSKLNASREQKRSQQPHSVGSRVAVGLTSTAKEGRRERAGKVPTTKESESEQQPIYANCKEEEEEEEEDEGEEEEELYTEVA